MKTFDSVPIVIIYQAKLLKTDWSIGVRLIGNS